METARDPELSVGLESVPSLPVSLESRKGPSLAVNRQQADLPEPSHPLLSKVHGPYDL